MNTIETEMSAVAQKRVDDACRTYNRKAEAEDKRHVKRERELNAEWRAQVLAIYDATPPPMREWVEWPDWLNGAGEADDD